MSTVGLGSSPVFVLRKTEMFLNSQTIDLYILHNRIGLMFVIATNISSWIINVVDEALHLLHVNGDDHDEDDDYRLKRADQYQITD